jgi:hypothetical protein
MLRGFLLSVLLLVARELQSDEVRPNLQITGDFDGNGELDEAIPVFSPAGNPWYLAVTVNEGATEIPLLPI